MSIAISATTRGNLLALQMVSDQIDDVQTRLASGKRVNSAFDGTNVSSTGLSVVASTNSFQLDSDITTALANIASALTSIQSQTSSLGNSQAIINARMQFDKSMATTLQSGSDDLVKSDSTADGALLLTLQTRQQLAESSLSMTNSSDKLALRLLGFS